MSAHLPLSEFLGLNDRLKIAILFVDGATTGVDFYTEVKAISGDSLMFQLPAALGSNVSLRAGHQIAIEIVTNDQVVFQCKTTIVRFQEEAPSGFWVEVPPTFKENILNRRRHVRVSFRFIIGILYPKGSKASPLHGESVNLSGGGIRFLSPRPFRSKEIV